MRTIARQLIHLLWIGAAVPASLYAQQAALPIVGGDGLSGRACHRGLSHSGLAGCDGDQQPEHQSSSPAPQSSTADSSPKHLFYVVPAYNVAYGHEFKPLTPRQKFHEWFEGTYDPRGLGLVAAEAATLEHSSRDGFCGYGHGGGGYLKCYGSMNLDLTVSSFFGDALFPVLMHQDARYFRLGQGSMPKRMGYALARVFVTHNDSGHMAFEAAALSGSVLAAGVSNVYLPRRSGLWPQPEPLGD